MSKLIVPLHGSAPFIHTGANTAADSIQNAILHLVGAGRRADAEIVWSSLSITFDVATVEETRLTENHARIYPGRSTVLARAEAIITPNEGSN